MIMKKLVILTIICLMHIMTFAAPLLGTFEGSPNFVTNKVADWDKPLLKNHFTNPIINTIHVTIDWNGCCGFQGYMLIGLNFSDWTDSHTWRAIIGVRTWKRIGLSWGWTIVQYTIDVPPNELNYQQLFPIAGSNQYVYSCGPCGSGVFSVDDTQITNISWGPL
jgi:hypothetical protein